MNVLFPRNKAHAKCHCHVWTQSMAIYSTRNKSSVCVVSYVKKVTNRWRAKDRGVQPSRKLSNLARQYSLPRTTKSRFPQNTTAHFSGFNSRYDTFLVVQLIPRAVPAVLRTCVLAVRVCARTCARMQPRKAFLFRDERRRCRVSDKHEQHACLRKISGMSLHTPR